MTERVKLSKAVEILGMSERTVRAKAACGEIPSATKDGSTWTFSERALRQFVARHEVKSRATSFYVRGFVYFVRSGDYIKIGFSEGDRAKDRIKALQTSNPHDFAILKVITGSRQKEAKLHAKFANAKHRGEWFKATPELLAFIEKTR